LSTYNVIFAMHYYLNQLTLLSFPTRRSSDLSSKLMPGPPQCLTGLSFELCVEWSTAHTRAISFGNTNHLTNLRWRYTQATADARSEEHTSELQSRENLVCRLMIVKKKYYNYI